MEHLLFALIAETISAIDRRLQKPLASVIPNLQQLRAQPEDYLSREVVQVGPRRRHALATFLGLVAGLVVVAILIVIFANIPRQGRWDPWRIIGTCISFAVAFWVARTITLRWLTGGTATLRAQGVELAYGDRVAFMPWSLFRAEGTIFEPDAKMAVLPIDPTVPVAISETNEDVRAVLPAEVNLPQAQSGDSPHLALRDLYEVRVSELAVLFLEIGRRMRQDVPAQVGEAFSLVPIAVPEKDGWLVLQLTQLPMPPYCAGCGTLTSQNLELAAMKYGQSSVVKIPVPFCADCAMARRRAQWTGGLIGLAVAIVVAATVVSWLFPPMRFFEWCLITAAMGCLIGIPFALIGIAIQREGRLPIRMRDYRPDKGTVRIRLRDPRRAAPLLNAMGLSLAPEPESVALVDETDSCSNPAG